MAVHVSLLREGVLSRPSNRTWQRDVELGANTLTIATGHTVDAMRFVAGDFGRLSAVVATQAKQWLDTGTGTLLDVTSPDNVLLSGRLANGAVASVHIGAIPFAGSGYRMEIYGRDGTLVASGEDSPQLGRGCPARGEGRQHARRRCRCRSASTSPRLVRRQAKPSTSVRCTRCSLGQSVTAKAASRPSRPRSNCIAWSTPSGRRRKLATT